MNLDTRFVRYLIRKGTADKRFLEEVMAKEFDKAMRNYAGDESELCNLGIVLALSSELDEDEAAVIRSDFLATLTEHYDDFRMDGEGWNLVHASASLAHKLGCVVQVFRVMAMYNDYPEDNFGAFLKELKKLGITVPKGKRAWAELKPASEPKPRQPEEGGKKGKKK